MDERDATEIAYKNGFEAGMREFAERLKDKAYLDGAVSIAQELVVDVRDIDDLVEEMTGKQRKAVVNNGKQGMQVL